MGGMGWIMIRLTAGCRFPQIDIPTKGISFKSFNLARTILPRAPRRMSATNYKRAVTRTSLRPGLCNGPLRCARIPALRKLQGSADHEMSVLPRGGLRGSRFTQAGRRRLSYPPSPYLHALQAQSLDGGTNRRDA